MIKRADEWEIKFWNFIFPSHELIIDLEIVIRYCFDIGQIHIISEPKELAKTSQNIPKYTHNTLCKRQVPFLTFSHLRQWFHSIEKIFKNFQKSLHMVADDNDENFYRIWNLTNKIGVFNLLQMTKYWLGKTWSKSGGSQNRKSNRQNQTSNASWSEILICHSIYVLKKDIKIGCGLSWDFSGMIEVFRTWF